eukprot:420883-Alexandrium_andersonii.AAC.1
MWALRAASCHRASVRRATARATRRGRTFLAPNTPELQLNDEADGPGWPGKAGDVRPSRTPFWPACSCSSSSGRRRAARAPRDPPRDHRS